MAEIEIVVGRRHQVKDGKRGEAGYQHIDESQRLPALSVERSIGQRQANEKDWCGAAVTDGPGERVLLGEQDIVYKTS